MEISENHIPVGQLQWFLDIDIYLQFVMGETIWTAESQQDEVHASKVRKTKEQCIVVLAFKTDVHPILGALGEGKESTKPLTDIRTPELWNAHDEVREVYLQPFKYL